jgi:NitT/TauT family transport system ATP-binding protein
VAAMTSIQIDIKQKTYAAKGTAKAHLAIENFQLSLEANQFVCLVGSSGCGKTTLLNSIAGLDTDFVGEIIVGQQAIKPTIGYVFQNPRLLPWRTVRENIELALNPPQFPFEKGTVWNPFSKAKTKSPLSKGKSHHPPLFKGKNNSPLFKGGQGGFQESSFVDTLLQIMQLDTVQNVYPERLSLGMSRRVAIIRAFAINPDVLLMDEPFVSLDPPTARQVRSLLIQLWQQRPHTVLFVTHDLREAIALADKLVFLSPPPMQIISQIAVPIPRHQREDEKVIDAFRQQLISDHPAISALL